VNGSIIYDFLFTPLKRMQPMSSDSPPVTSPVLKPGRSAIRQLIGMVYKTSTLDKLSYTIASTSPRCRGHASDLGTTEKWLGWKRAQVCHLARNEVPMDPPKNRGNRDRDMQLSLFNFWMRHWHPTT